MFFLKKLLQFIEEKGFRAGAGADKQWGARAAVPAGGRNERAAKISRGRVVRREKAGARVQGGCVRGAASESAARGEFRNADEQYAWYFAVRDWFARTPQESGFRRTIGGGAVRRAAEERGTRGRRAIRAFPPRGFVRQNRRLSQCRRGVLPRQASDVRRRRRVLCAAAFPARLKCGGAHARREIERRRAAWTEPAIGRGGFAAPPFLVYIGWLAPLSSRADARLLRKFIQAIKFTNITNCRGTIAKFPEE